ncbi:MAG: site-2 protease family protein [candidate division Zixibacteria bacterium]
MSDTADNIASRIADSLAGHIDVSAVFTSKKEIVVKGRPGINSILSEQEIKDRLNEFGNNIDVSIFDSSVIIRIRQAKTTETKDLPWLNIGLFLMTLASTIVAGAFRSGGPWGESPWLIFRYPVEMIIAGAPFSISLLTILLFHEFGHYIAGRKHGVNMSLPFFVPAPPIISPIGTLGALIISRSPFLNRRQLMDVGAAGPLAGLAVAVAVLFLGINQSAVEPIPSDASLIYFGESLLFKFITFIIKGPIPEGHGLLLSSTAFAGWVGILVTMFNLLPLGQLDGGRIVYALIGRWQKLVSRAVIFGLMILSFQWPGWLLWMFIGFMVKPTHPPTILDEIPIGKGRKIIGLISIIAFIICFIPVPIRLG